MPQNRIGYIDIMKGIAIICVVVGHFVRNAYVGVAIWSFHLPLFVFLNGYFYKEKRFWLRLIQSFKSYIIPYLIVLAILLLCETLLIWIGHISNLSYSEAINRRVISGIYGLHSNSVINRPSNVVKIGAVWFLLALFWANLLMTMITTISKKMYQFIIVLLFLCVAMFQTRLFCIPLGINYGCAFLLWIWIGYLYNWLLKNGSRVIQLIDSNRYVLLFAIVWIGIIAIEGLSGHTFSVPSLSFPLYGLEVIGAVSGIMVIKWLSTLIDKHFFGISQALQYLGRNSIWLLCVHAVDLEIYRHLFMDNGVFPQILHCIADILIAILLCNCYRSIKKRRSIALS